MKNVFYSESSDSQEACAVGFYVEGCQVFS